jgi:plastocyanin
MTYRGSLRAALLCGAWLVAGHAAGAADLSVAVQEPAGHGVEGIVVLAEPDVASSDHSAVRTVIMDQKHMQFVPDILVIQTGSAVDFPNSDQIKHQVYSFSPAKTFQLSLYAGRRYPPVRFDRPGLITVGCNIHDFMIGFIYVTDSPFFGRTDADGKLQLHGLAGGGYLVTLWHPGMHEPGGTFVRRRVTLTADASASELFQLTHPLHRDMPHMGNKRWADY